MTAPLRDRVIVAVGEQYDIRGELGRGGMSVVYRALDLRLHRPVAIKVLPPEFAFDRAVKARFLREAETAAKLGHPHIVPIYSVDERDGIAYFVMALVEGENLAARLAREPRPPLRDVRRIIGEVAEALAYAHRHGVVHRDIKPDNILLEGPAAHVRVTDFGVARAMEESAHLTVTGVAVGTPAYMSPEQALGERTVDGRSDIYSLGVVAYQMLAGEPPFRASNTPAMLMKHVSERPRPLAERRPELPRTLAAAVMRALAKAPSDRWQDASAFRAAALEGAEPAQRAPAAELSRPAREARAGALPAADVLVGGEGLLGLDGERALFDPHAADRSARRQARETREGREAQRQAHARRRPSPNGEPAESVERRIVAFRRSVAGYGGVVVVLAGINAATTPWVPWFVFPALGMGLPLLFQGGSLWAEGVRLGDVFGPNRRLRAGPGEPIGLRPAELARLAPPDVLAGPHGDAVRRAAEDRAHIVEAVTKLPKADRALLPEVGPTVNALVERAASLATTLHRLDASLGPASLPDVEVRIARARQEPEGAERERRLALLERQRATIEELTRRRAELASRMESACLALANLKLDLAKLRSAGVQSALQDVTSATQEARALSREIGHVLDAAAELKRG